MISQLDQRRELSRYHEQCLIGSVLLFPNSLDEIPDLEPTHLFDHRHQAIFSCVREMHETNRHIDTATLIDRLSSRADFGELNQDNYLAQMWEVVPNGCHAASYAKIVKRNWLERETVNRCRDLMTEAPNCDEESDITAAVERHLASLADSATPTTHVEMKDLLLSVMEDIGQRRTTQSGVGLKTGFVKVDQHLIGLRPGELIVIAATAG